MNRPWAALGLVLALCAIMPRSAQAQGRPGRPTIGRNYPNPFNPETKAGFSVGRVQGEGSPCIDPTKLYRVSVKVYNMLGKVVGVPFMFGGNAPGVPGGTPLDRVQLACGDYRLRWDGKTLNGHEAASGLYRIVIDQDGVLASIQVIVGK